MKNPKEDRAGRIMRLLRRVGEVEWARVAVGPALDGSPRPPLVVWRFKPGHESGEAKLAASIGAFHGAVDWLLDHSSRNWSLQPRRVAEAFWEDGWRVDAELFLHFSRHDPGFSRRSMDDFEDLVTYLEEKFS